MRIPALLPLFLLALAGSFPLNAQVGGGDGVLRGTVRDEAGDPVPDARVALESFGGGVVRSVRSGSGGTFAIEGIAPGVWQLRVERIGYELLQREIEVPGPGEPLDLRLVPEAVRVEGVAVRAERSRDRIRFEEEAAVTSISLSGAELRLVPGVAERDPIRALDVLPGVVSTSDFGAAFNVRGGSADQNLILLDGMPIFNPFHLGGFFSVFNGDMVERAELFSGGFPARFGGRISSVLAVETDPGPGVFDVQGGISILASRAAVSGALPESWNRSLGLGSSRLRASVRRSYFDAILRPFLDFPYALTDVQAISEFVTRRGGRLTLTGYSGSDLLDLTTVDPETFPLRIRWGWGNDVAGVRWESPLPSDGTLTLRGGWSRYRTGLAFPDFQDTELRSRIDQGLLRADLRQPVGDRWVFGAGIQTDLLSYDNLAATGGTEFGGGSARGWQPGGYAELAWTPPAWLIEGGVRWDLWTPDEEAASSRDVVGPRFAVKRFLGADWAVKGSAGRYAQFLHSVRDEELPLGLDIWVLSGARVPVGVSDQIQGGIEGYPAPDWYVSLEGYRRDFRGMIGNNPAEDPNDPLDDLLRGTGASRGVDLLIRKSGTGITGWVSASWLRATRTFADPFSGADPSTDFTYAPIFDRRIDLDAVVQLPLPGGIEAGARWTFGSGLPYTRPLASFELHAPSILGGGRLQYQGGTPEEGEEPPAAVLLGPRNGERYPPYHRLDLSLRKQLSRPWGELTPYLDIVNVYNRRNVLFYFHDFQADPPTRAGISMFPVLPTFGVDLRFR